MSRPEHTTAEKLEAASYIATQVARDCDISRVICKVKETMDSAIGGFGRSSGFRHNSG